MAWNSSASSALTEGPEFSAFVLGFWAEMFTGGSAVCVAASPAWRFFGGAFGKKATFDRSKAQRGVQLFSATPRSERFVSSPRSMEYRVRRHRRRHADDGAVYRDQGGEPRLPALLPHGRFL